MQKYLFVYIEIKNKKVLGTEDFCKLRFAAAAKRNGDWSGMISL